MSAPVARENAKAGERMTFLSGEHEPLQKFHLVIEPVSYGPPAHIHPHATEVFTVTAGTLNVRSGSQWRRVHAGESVTIPPGTVHTYANRSGALVEVDVEVNPGIQLRGFFDGLYSLAEQGRLTRNGGLPLRQAAALLLQYPDALTIAGPPVVVQRLLWRVLAALPRG